jgi:hypothetical protein
LSINKNKKNNRYKINSRLYERLKIEFQLVAKGRPKPEGFGERIINAERNAKIGLANRKPKPKGFGKNPNQNHKACKPVLQYDLNGTFIAEHMHCLEASIATGVDATNINRVCNRERSTAGNYQWKWQDDLTEVGVFDKNSYRFSKPVLQIDKLTDEVVAEFAS